MNKKDFLNILDIASIVSICIATILVFVFQFTGSFNVIKFSLIMYTASFLILSVFYCTKLVFVCKNIAIDTPVIINAKNEKIVLSIKFALSIIAFVFALVILILY